MNAQRTDAAPGRRDTRGAGRRQAGAATISATAASLTIEHKGQQDLVSIADRAVEELIRQRAGGAFPGRRRARRGGRRRAATADRTWVLDPIDGTFNFLKGIPCWGVVAAYVVDGGTVIGLTYDPVHDELFVARRGGGAFRNGTPIRVSGQPTVDTSCLALAYSFRQPDEELCAHGRCGDLDAGLRAPSRRLHRHPAVLGCRRALRRLRHAVLLVLGRLAGLILVEEAGGLATDFVGDYGLLGKGGVVACTPGIGAQVEAISGLRLQSRLTRAGDRRMVACDDGFRKGAIGNAV